MSDAVARFENLGVDFDMLVNRRDKPHGLTEKRGQLEELMSESVDPAQHHLRTMTDEADEAQALQQDILERTRRARKEAMAGLSSEYSRQYSPEDDVDVALTGEHAFAWIVVNQVLHNVEPENAAENAEGAINALGGGESGSTILLSGEEDTSMIVTGVSLGHIALTAELMDINRDTIGVAGDEHIAYIKRRSGKHKWQTASPSVREDGVTLSQYPGDIFEPFAQNCTSPGTLGTKLLVTPQDVALHLVRAAEFAHTPELGLSLFRDNAIQLTPDQYLTLKRTTKEDFYSNLGPIADRAIRKATDIHGPLRNYGEYQLLVDKVLEASNLGDPAPREALKQRIVETMREETTPPFVTQSIARVLRQSAGGQEMARRVFRDYIARLNHAVAAPSEESIALVAQNPEFVEVALDNAEIHADYAVDHSIIGKRDRKRLQRLIKAERKTLAKQVA